MENIEHHYVVDGRIGETGSVRDEVAKFGPDVGHAGRLGFGARRGDHVRVDIESGDGTSTSLSGRNGERSVAAAELRDVADSGDQLKLAEHRRDVEERFPRRLLGHAAFTRFHRGTAQ